MNHLEVAFLGFAFMAALTVPIEVAASDEQVGDEVRVTLSYYNSSESSDGGSSSSRGSNAYVERVIAVSGSGIELEFDLPEEVPENSRLIEWQFPVRVFEAPDGSMALINVHEMEGRRDEWLAAAGLTADACGSWYFTWNAFKVECDPRSVLPLLQDLRLKSAELLEGAIYRHPTASSGAPLEMTASDDAGKTFVASMPVDAGVLRQEKAESDLVVAQIMGEELTLEQAMAERSTEEISGTLTVTFQTDDTGNAWRQVRVAEITTVEASGVEQTSVSTQTIERQSITES